MLEDKTMRWVDIELRGVDTTTIVEEQLQEIEDKNEGLDTEPCVYMFWLGFPNMYKIGMSTDWRQRLKSFQTTNPFIKPIIVIVDSGHLEKKIHKSLAGYKHEADGSNEIFVFKNNQHALFFITQLASKHTVVYLDVALRPKVYRGDC